MTQALKLRHAAFDRFGAEAGLFGMELIGARDHRTEMVAPKPNTQFAGTIQRGANGQPTQERRTEASIKEGKAGGEDAGVRLQTADQHTLHLQASEMVDHRGWRQIAVLDEDPVGRNQALVRLAGFPAQLALERRHRLIVPLDGRD